MEMNRREPHGRSGLSMIEVLIVLTLMAIVLVKVGMIARASKQAVKQETNIQQLEDHARIIVDRIALAVMSCDRETLTPILQPYNTGVRYQVSLGMDEGDVIWSDPVEILLENESTIVWKENPSQPDERTIVWSRQIEPLLEGELVNDLDDNGNGLIDEEGLNFIIDGNEVTIRISMGVEMVGGERMTRSVEATVTCRNNPLQ